MQQLQHKVPHKAIVEFRRGTEAFKKQQVAAAVDHLKAALAIDPEFVDAHNDLGVAYLALRDFEQGAVHFKQAIALAPTYEPAIDNLCILLLQLKRFGGTRKWQQAGF